MPRIRIRPAGIEIPFDPASPPKSGYGREGSLLDILLAHDFPITHVCGGKCECTTCHVIVREGVERLSEPEVQEEDRLDMADGLTPTSRLACQAVPKDDVTIEIPE